MMEDILFVHTDGQQQTLDVGNLQFVKLEMRKKFAETMRVCALLPFLTIGPAGLIPHFNKIAPLRSDADKYQMGSSTAIHLVPNISTLPHNKQIDVLVAVRLV
jgi:hypothetical protein